MLKICRKNRSGGIALRKLQFIGLIICIAGLFIGCQRLPDVGTADITAQEWQMMLDSTKKSSLNIYYDYNDQRALEWLSKVVNPYIEELYSLNITLTPLDLKTAYAQLKDDKINERATGQYDLFLINNDGFKKLKSAGLLYGPYVSKLPNVSFNQVQEAYEFNYYDGTTTENQAALIGKTQLIMVFNEDKLEKAPKTLADLKTYLEANSGKFAIPSLDSKEGRAFVNTVALTLCDNKKLYDTTLSQAELVKVLSPAIQYFKALKPNLYMQGQEFPRTVEDLDRLFKDESVHFSMTFDPNKAVTASKDEKYPDAAKSFVFTTGTTGYCQYAVIPFNSSNKSGAMVFINELLGSELQSSMYNPKNWGNLPSVDPIKMPDGTGDKITKMAFKRSALKFNELTSVRIPQLPLERERQIKAILKETLGYK